VTGEGRDWGTSASADRLGGSSSSQRPFAVPTFDDDPLASFGTTIGPDADPYGAAASDPYREDRSAPAMGQGAAIPSISNLAADQYGRPADPYGRPADPYNAPADPYSAPADPYNAPADPYSAPADPYNAPADPYGRPADPYGRPADPYGQPADRYGHADPAAAPSAPAAERGARPDTQAASIRVSVAIVEPHPTIRDGLMRLLGEGGTPFDSLQELASRLTGSVPVVVILGPSCATPADLAIAERLIPAHPALGAILVVEELTTALLQAALRAGVKDVLALNGEAEQLTSAVQRVALTLDSSSRRSAHGHGHAPQGASDDGDLGQVISVFSTKGGAGKSVISTNLAVCLAQRSSKPVCLVDADLQFGDAAVMLKLTPHHTIVDAVEAIDRMDNSLLESLLVTHEPSGLRVLPAPLEPAFADQVGAAEMIAIVERLRTFCSYIVVDTPAYFNDVVLGLVEISDRIVLVAGMDIPNIKNVKIGLQTLRLLNTPMEKLLLVLNRSNSKVKLDIGEVERTLQAKADALVPSDVLIPQSVNKGVPVVLHAPKSAVARSLVQLAEQFTNAPTQARRR
jgi:pilus assembly protein CpaE